MALDRSADYFAHRFLCLIPFLSVLVIPHRRQTKLVSSLSTFLSHISIH